MENLYLVKCKVLISEYMGEEDEGFDAHIVQAIDEKEAKKKLKTYYAEVLTSQYCTHYYPFIISIENIKDISI